MNIKAVCLKSLGVVYLLQANLYAQSINMRIKPWIWNDSTYCLREENKFYSIINNQKQLLLEIDKEQAITSVCPYDKGVQIVATNYNRIRTCFEIDVRKRNVKPIKLSARSYDYHKVNGNILYTEHKTIKPVNPYTLGGVKSIFLNEKCLDSLTKINLQFISIDGKYAFWYSRGALKCYDISKEEHFICENARTWQRITYARDTLYYYRSDVPKHNDHILAVYDLDKRRRIKIELGYALKGVPIYYYDNGELKYDNGELFIAP
jgi:hypothetical protein